MIAASGRVGRRARTNVPLRLGPANRDPALDPEVRKETPMSRTPIALTLSSSPSRSSQFRPPSRRAASRGGVRIQGVCTQQSTSKLKLSRDDRGIEIEFQVDQNRNGVPWKVTLRRNGQRVASLTAKTRAPSGSFEIRRVIAGGSARPHHAIATRAGETCTRPTAVREDRAARPRASTTTRTLSLTTTATTPADTPEGLADRPRRRGPRSPRGPLSAGAPCTPLTHRPRHRTASSRSGRASSQSCR